MSKSNLSLLICIVYFVCLYQLHIIHLQHFPKTTYYNNMLIASFS